MDRTHRNQRLLNSKEDIVDITEELAAEREAIERKLTLYLLGFTGNAILAGLLLSANTTACTGGAVFASLVAIRCAIMEATTRIITRKRP